MSLPVPAEQTHLTHPKYRADIDGLRAIAVLSVVGFHAFPNWIKGGFVGVDIFFVISGFLISSIIFSSLEKGTFSFTEFYARRVKRIFPALILVMTFCFAFGWFTLFPDEYKQLGKHITAGAGFISNLILWREAGYFDNAAYTKPLLHLWSLGIEEQFYIVWPLLLYLAWKRRFNFLTLTIAIVAISFSFSVNTTYSDITQSFYSPASRFWELVIGSILAYITLLRINPVGKIDRSVYATLANVISPSTTDKTLLRDAIPLFGAALIGISILFIRKEFTFPGWWVALPTLGAILIISAGPHAWLNRSILSRRILVWIGLISYPLYLWHWPLLSFARIVEGRTPSVEIRIGSVIISIALAWLTYRLIEKPIRFSKFGKENAIVLFVLMITIGYAGYNCYIRDGLSFRYFSKSNVSLSSGNDGGDGGVSINDCGLSDEEKKLFAYCRRDSRQTPKFALLGDSKAGALYGGLVRTSNENGRWLFIGGTKHYNGRWYAPDVISKNSIYATYQPVAEMAVNAIANNQNIETVVWVTATRALFNLKEGYLIEDLPSSHNYETALEGVINTINPLIKAGKKIVIVTDNPTLPSPEDCLPRITSLDLINNFVPKTHPSCQLSISHHMKLTEQYRKLLAQVENNNPESIKIFDTTNYLCDVKNGVCFPSKNGRSMYSKTDHISDYAAGLIGRELNTFLIRDNSKELR